MIIAKISPSAAIKIIPQVQKQVKSNIYAYNEATRLVNVKKFNDFLTLDFTRNIFFLVEDETFEEPVLFDILLDVDGLIQDIANSEELVYVRSRQITNELYK